MTTIIKENEIRQCVNISEDIIPIIENAFVSLSNEEAVMPPILRLDITENNGEVDVKTAYIKGLDSFAIKMSSGFYNNPSLGLPSTGGVMFLVSTKTGKLETVLLDGGYLTLYIIEILFGKPVNKNIQEIIFKIGFAIIITLAVFLTYNDIINLFKF